MQDNKVVKVTKKIYPQIYAYQLPSIKEDKGWVKIGYTERKDVDERIKEQTNTAAIRLDYNKLWSSPAKFTYQDKWFKDKQFHTYLKNYKGIMQRPNSEWFFYNKNPEKSYNDFIDFCNTDSEQDGKASYQLRLEQEDAVNKTLNYVNSHKNGKFLWNAKPRFGKTLTSYDLIRKLMYKKVLIITNRPAVANSWFDDFNKFIAWQTDFAFVSTSDSLKNRSVMSRNEFMNQIDNKNGKSRMITFISLQDLKGSAYFGGGYDKLKWVKELSWDALIIDESHEGVDTLKTDIALDNIKRNFTLYLSGTPFKELASNDFDESQIYNWTYVDEQKRKKEWANKEDSPYENLPKLNMLSYQMSKMITEEINEGANINGKNIDYAFDLNDFFDTDDKGRFIHGKEVKKWLDYLTHNEKYPFSTAKLRNELKHTFWILNRVNSAKALERLLKKHPVFKDYKIILAAGKFNVNNDTIDENDQINNQKSFSRVRDAINNNDKTITLSVGQLTTGVTIPEWSAVMMLSNVKSPSLYMQAAFRAQNPWSYKDGNDIIQKENAYVFDFSPERTLTIYDDFANNLSIKTSNGGGSTKDRMQNIQELLNFFPVISEDNEGKMVELDVDKVLTIPKSIKANEVVKRGFMSNLLFQNVSGIFVSNEVKEIIEQLNPVKEGKNIPDSKKASINTKDVNVNVDDMGNVELDNDIVISKTDAYLGKKVYGNIEKIFNDVKITSKELPDKIANDFCDDTTEYAESIAKENNVEKSEAKNIVKQNSKIIAREVEIIQRKADIKNSEAEIEYKKSISETNLNSEKLLELKKDFENKKKKISDDFKNDINLKINDKIKVLTKKSTKDIITKSEYNKKNYVEDDVRSRLRGFSRTIPSFLMAYGNKSTNLSNFDKIVNDDIFKEVTGINLSQFRKLRDEYKFFDQVVFDESVIEFMNKKYSLADYFNESNTEDIFDYIPPQKTNQIYTPKKTVKMMIDNLEKNDPNIFKNKDKTFVDLYVKSGLYLTEITKRLYVGLKDQIPNNDERIKHILENQIYGFAPSEIIFNIAHNYIFGFSDNIDDINTSHFVNLDTTSFARGESEETFEEKCNELFGKNN